MDSTTRATERSVEIELAAVPSSAAEARRAAGALDGAAHPESLARARVLISEIVTALSLAQGAGPIRLRLEAADGRLRGEVASSAHSPSRLLSGWARLLVDRLSDEWGESAPDRALWFEVSRIGELYQLYKSKQLQASKAALTSDVTGTTEIRPSTSGDLVRVGFL